MGAGPRAFATPRAFDPSPRAHTGPDILSLGAGLAPLLSDETPVLKIMSPLAEVASGPGVPASVRFLHPVGLSRRVDWFVTRESLEGCATRFGASPATPLPPTRSQTPAHRDAPSPLLEAAARSRPQSIQVRRRPGARPRSSSSSRRQAPRRVRGPEPAPKPAPASGRPRRLGNPDRPPVERHRGRRRGERRGRASAD